MPKEIFGAALPGGSQSREGERAYHHIPATPRNCGGPRGSL